MALIHTLGERVYIGGSSGTVEEVSWTLDDDGVLTYSYTVRLDVKINNVISHMRIVSPTPTLPGCVDPEARWVT